MTKLAIALQFYEGDKPQAMRLARMIADIEPRRRDDVVLVLCARFDSSWDRETLDYVSKKFEVQPFKTDTHWTGWPAGPNGMARDLLLQAHMNLFNGYTGPHGLLMMEPDCIPVDRNWIDSLYHAWNNQPESILIMGAWRDSGGADGHINGNCIVRPLLAGLPGVLKSFNQHLAWDCALAPFLKTAWCKTRLIQNCFESRNAKPEDIDPLAVMVHGYKDDSLYNIARERMKL